MLQLLYIPELLVSIEARTSLGSRTRQITMTDNLGTGKHLMKDCQQVRQPFGLSRCACVARQSVLVKSTLIADANRAMVVRNGMSADLQQHAMLCHRTVASDIEVIANLAELTRTMVTEQLLHSVVLVAPCSRAVQHQILNVVGRHQISSSHNNNNFDVNLKGYRVNTNGHELFMNFSEIYNYFLLLYGSLIINDNSWLIHGNSCSKTQVLNSTNTRAYSECSHRCNDSLHNRINDLHPCDLTLFVLVHNNLNLKIKHTFSTQITVAPQERPRYYPSPSF